MAMERHSVVSPKASSQSSDKLLQILECISKNKLPLRLQDISEQVGMSQSTVLRYLNTLANTGYVYQEEDTLRYGLTWKICALSQNLDSNIGLRNIVNPFISRLSMEKELGACLVVDYNFECLYLDCITPNELPHILRIGRSAPLHATGSGKVLLASYNDTKVEEYIQTKHLTQLTDYTITSRDALFEELKRIRSTGYGIDAEECEIGLRCISIPLYNYSGNIIAALSLFGSTSVLTPDRIEPEIVPLLREVSAIISSRLGYSPELIEGRDSCIGRQSGSFVSK